MELSHIADKFSHGLGGALALAMIAFSVVFLVLIALTLIIMGTRYLADFSERKTSKPSGPGQQTASVVATPTPSAPAAPAEGDKNVIAAVIAAAIAASGGGRAISVRPLTVTNRGKPSAWKTAGRMDLVEGFE